MARKKPTPKPLFEVKHEFYDSLDRLCHESIMLIQAVEMVIRQGGIKGAAADVLKERIAAFRAALESAPIEE